MRRTTLLLAAAGRRCRRDRLRRRRGGLDLAIVGGHQALLTVELGLWPVPCAIHRAMLAPLRRDISAKFVHRAPYQHPALAVVGVKHFYAVVGRNRQLALCRRAKVVLHDGVDRLARIPPRADGAAGWRRYERLRSNTNSNWKVSVRPGLVRRSAGEAGHYICWRSPRRMSRASRATPSWTAAASCPHHHGSFDLSQSPPLPRQKISIKGTAVSVPLTARSHGANKTYPLESVSRSGSRWASGGHTGAP